MCEYCSNFLIVQPEWSSILYHIESTVEKSGNVWR
jgi:hypothetical protein